MPGCVFRVQGFVDRPYLEDQGDLASRLIDNGDN